MGAAVPVIGPIASAAAGSLFSGLANRKAPKSFSPLSAEQQNALSALFPGLVQGGVSAGQTQQQIGQGIQQALPSLLAGLTPGGQDQIFQQAVAEPTMRDFEQNILPQLRQSAQNAGASSSSAFNRALASAGTDLAANLASQRASFGLGQQQQSLANLLGISDQQLRQQLGAAGVAQAGTQQNLVGSRPNLNPFDVLAGGASQIFTGTLPGLGALTQPKPVNTSVTSNKDITLQELLNALNANNA